MTTTTYSFLIEWVEGDVRKHENHKGKLREALEIAKKHAKESRHPAYVKCKALNVNTRVKP